MFFRFILVNIFSFIKRFFAFNATIYNTIVFIPLLTVLTIRISKKALFFVFFFSILLLITGNIDAYGKFIMYFLLLLAIPMFKQTSFEGLLNKSFYFFILVSLYGISQKLFGYSSVEINWIQSGLSFADEREFISNDIRPFSTFASMPEFTFFIAIYLYHFSVQKKKLLILFSFMMLYLAGSRGVFISTLVAYFFVFIWGKSNRKYLILSFFTSLLLFLFLVFIFPIFFSSDQASSRMLAYGTFNGRVEFLDKVLSNGSISNLFTGLDLTVLDLENTFDNLYFMLIAHFGIFGAIYFLYFFLKQKINRKNFYFLTIFLGYGFYADMVFSYYLMFLVFFAVYSYSDLINEDNNINKTLDTISN
ncbi:hypothetical protein FA048_05495 [Pedobacter polaris]|uniref:O-antigen ligase domain-containing protein n=1 Tax=Pedobacter polaris TaxID=2571273 RepID=A0A4U1CV31_9SPHI|nr:hypothetical protein [Pedobacter polaris]TKC13071.1 hypothetical protein FA048_05495 [Pedobacter polaris]